MLLSFRSQRWKRALSCAILTGAMLFIPGGNGPTWRFPVEPTSRVTAPYRAPATPYAAGHRGIDVRAMKGDAIVAPVAGTVSFVGRIVDRPVLSLRVDARTVVSFEPLATELRAGDAVQRGERLGAVDTGGHCASGCLHLGVRVDGVYVNPMRYFFVRPVLLPW